MFEKLLSIVFLILLVYCAFTVLYLFVFSLAGFVVKSSNDSNFSMPLNRIAVLVPAYKEDNIILSTAKNLLNQNYPKNWFDIYIIADSFQSSTIRQLKQLPVNVIEVSFENSTKTKSLNKAFETITKPFDIALICDADNLLSDDFLRQINFEFANGEKAVQARRVAKNIDTSFAILDGCSEAINNNIFRKGANALRLSSAVIGSGMAFEYTMLKNILLDISAVSGFDKPLQLKVVEIGIKIKYLENALIFDEKIDNPNAFKQQRKRWLLSQFIYLKEFFIPGFQQLFKGNFSYFNLAVLNNIVLPRVLLIFLLFASTLLSYFLQPVFVFSNFFIASILYCLTLLMALPKQYINKKFFQAVTHLPKAIFVMIISLLQIKKAKEVFIHTVHTKNEITNPLFKTK